MIRSIPSLAMTNLHSMLGIECFVCRLLLSPFSVVCISYLVRPTLLHQRTNTRHSWQSQPNHHKCRHFLGIHEWCRDVGQPIPQDRYLEQEAKGAQLATRWQHNTARLWSMAVRGHPVRTRAIRRRHCLGAQDSRQYHDHQVPNALLANISCALLSFSSIRMHTKRTATQCFALVVRVLTHVLPHMFRRCCARVVC
jgi:hypothetical protein